MLLAAITILAGGMLGGPTPPASAGTLAVSAVAIQSSAGTDTQYHTGDAITIRVTFGTETITAHTGATITIDVGGVNRTAAVADVASGGTNAYVDFTYRVVDSDRDTDGITVAAGTLGGSYTHTDAHTSVAFTQTVSASASHRVNVDVTNYDSDGDGLIEIENLHQLNAIRHDPDGNGQVAAGNAVAYATAFPGRSHFHGCPDTADADTDPGPCIGYELNADLNFDTDGNGIVGAGDDYPNWTPISSYTTTFNGNGHTITNLTINYSIGGTVSNVGLFAVVTGGGTIANVGLPGVNITSTFTGTGEHRVGSLVGFIRGTIRNCYVTGAISTSAVASANISSAGGLAGYMGQWGSGTGSASRLDASWAAVNVAVTSSSTAGGGAAGDAAGGLVGRLLGNATTPTDVTTSYARGTVTSGRGGSHIGGLIGRTEGSNYRVTASYWDTTTSGLSSSAGGSGVVGRTTAQLQSPTGYGATTSDTFYGWNIDVDGVTGSDDPWDFGSSSQYPALKYGGHNLVVQGRTVDYDVDDDGLIDISSLAQLDAVRYDLDGNGVPTDLNAYLLAFPNRDTSVIGRMGCELTDHDTMPITPNLATCTGYELIADLDFDTDGSGSVGAGDDYPNWVPIGSNASSYTAAFNGNGHTISNMTINTSDVGQVGLFGHANGGTLENVGLLDVSITASNNSSGTFLSVGGLAGYRVGAVRASYATGTINTTVGTAAIATSAGGIVGYLGFTTNTAQVDASWAAVNIAVTSSSSSASPDAAGGLVGRMVSQSGTAVTVTASWARGTATSSRPGSEVGGLVGSSSGTGASVSASHWDTDTSGLSTSAGGNGVVGRTTTQLKMPTDYGASAGDTFFGWNIDVDGDGNNDDPWDFGTSSQYPMLQYGRDAVSIARQRGVTITRVDYDTDNDNLIDITTLGQLNGIRYDLDGNGRTTGADSVGYLAAFPGVSRSMGCPAACIGYELMNDLDFDTDGDGSTHTSGTGDDDDDWYTTTTGTGAGWTPIGGHTSTAAPFTAIFEGNGNTIDNLYINLAPSAADTGAFVGLFADLGKPAVLSPAAPAEPATVRNVGLVNPYVNNARTATGAFVRTGALAGRNNIGTVSGSYVSGGSVTASQATVTGGVNNWVGCLLGYNVSVVSDSYAGCTVSATGTNAVSANAGDYAGGLIGESGGSANALVRRSYARGTVSSDDFAGGLLGGASGGGTVTTSHATGAVSVSAAGGRAGGLVGHMINANTAVSASFAKGAVSASGGGTNNVGGLVGYLIDGGSVTAAYATGAVSATGSASGVTNRVGGLIGRIQGSTTTVTASYAIGAVTGGGGSATDNLGGLVGSSANSGAVTNSHWNITVNTFTAVTNVSKTTTQLQEPTDYGAAAANAFYGWNVDLDGDSSADDPWDFGTTTDYPVISYGGISLRAQGRTPVDYDADNDGLIDIDTLAKLNAVRHDLDGNGQQDGGTGDTAYNAVFANRDRSAAGLMGCPLADHDDDADTPQQAHCTGYELIADLTFDTDASGGIAAGDDYWNSGAGWVPIIDSANADNGYTGVFEGNRHTIDYLFIDLAAAAATPLDVGLFGELDRGGVIRGVGLTNVSISRTVGNDGGIYAGALAGQNFGAITASSAAGSVSATDTSATSSYAGGLVGQNGNGGVIAASYADVAVAVNSLGVRAGGLVGHNSGGAITASHAMGAVTATDSGGVSAIGGLVGANSPIGSGMGAVPATITASYATGAVSGAGTAIGVRLLGGLIGGGTGTVTASYWDTTTTGITSPGGGTGKTTAELQSITGYDAGSIYANWNVNVDGVTGNDDPWHFGTASQYPTLKYGGFSPAAQGSAGMDYDTDSDGLIEITTLAQLDAIRLDLDGDGRPTSVHAYRSAFPVGDVGSDAEMGDAGRMGCSHSDPVVNTCLGYELMSDLDFDTDGSGSANAADDYWNGGAGWTPLGGHSGTPRPFVATFDGNGNTISNLYINLSTDGAADATFVGLFADIGIPGNPTASPAVPAVPGVVRNVTLAEPSVNNVRSGGAATGSTWVRTGALAGRSNAGSAVRGSAVTGGSVTGRQGVVAGNAFNLVGCLLGYNAGTVRDSSASCAATATGANAPPTGIDRAGGLVGQNANEVGGPGLIRDSSATGVVSGDSVAGGLVGQNGSNGQVTGSSATGAVSVSDAEGKAGGLAGILNGGADVRDSSATGASAVAGSGPNSFVGGLVGQIDSTGTTVTDSYATRAVSASGAGSFAGGGLGNLAGGLAGVISGGAIVSASYATGNVSTTAANSKLGGLAGRVDTTATLVRATYATGTVTTSGGGTNTLGGLVGETAGAPDGANPHLIHSSYATGRVSASGGGTNALSGLVGAAVGGAVTSQAAFSYYDNTTAGTGLTASPGGGTAQTTAALQGPTEYGSGIYVNWNLNLDEQAGGDDPWHFGGSTQYPVLQHSRGPLDIARQLTPVPAPADYDLDNDNLIDVGNLAQLNAIRWDLNGDGAGMTGAAAAGYLSAYPGYTVGMGCPGTCTGYELRANLNFDTNNDGMVNASDEIADFRTIGGTYSATFQGNGHTISNMQITNNELGHKGLFGELSPSGKIYAVGLIEPVLSNGGGANGRFGALVGYNLGAIYASYVRGGAVSTNLDDTILGGLVGKNGSSVSGQNDYGKIYASYSTATVASAGHEFIDSGGLVGNNLRGTIVASYAAGAVTGNGANSEYGCLTGVASSSGIPPVSSVITSSYYEGTGEGRVCTRGGAGASKSNLELLEEAGYDGIYATWNVDLDNADGDNDLATGGDDPWDFRVGHYPALKYGSAADVAAQRPLLAEAGAAVEAYSGQTVTLDGSGSRAPSGATYLWERMPDGAEPMVTINGATTPSPTFLAPTGLTSDTTMTFRLTLTADGRSVYDEVTVSIVAVRPNQLLSLSLTDSEGDAVGLAPPFVSLRYDYSASVPNQIASVTVTPGVLEGSTMTLNGQAVNSGAAVEIPLKYRGNQIVIVVTRPEPEPSETMDGETTDGETADETVEETPCSVENDGVKPCTYTVTVNRAVPPRLAFSPRSLTIEEGSTATYTVELDTRILTGAVTIAIASDNPDVTVSPTAVTLRPLDMAPRTITVTAASDADRNDETATLTHTANGAHYYDVIATVSVRVNDTTAPPPAPDPALSVSTTALRLAEGGSGSYTVALATRPADNVTVAIASDNDDVTTRPAALTFTTANWATAQRVTVSAASDDDTANDTATLTHTAAGGGYADAPPVSVAVSVTDDDTAGLAITPTVLNLIENGISAYIVSLTAQPSGNVTVTIASDNPDVSVRPAALVFTPTNWATPQAVLVITRADAGGGDELATLRMTAQGGGYTGQTGQVLASVDDKLAPLPAGSVTTVPDAPAGVSVYGPPGSSASATVSAPADDTPTTATGAGFGIGNAVAVSVSDAPDDGLEICLPVSDALRAEAGSALILTLLRYAAGSWTELAGARDLGDRVCAAGVTGQAAYAAAYALRPGTVLDLAASVGDTPGTIALSWTPPAAGASQVAVVVNVADDTDYCLDTLPGLDASSYTCAGRTAGQTYVALLIVLLPDGGYTLANIVRFELPAAGS